MNYFKHALVNLKYHIVDGAIHLRDLILLQRHIKKKERGYRGEQKGRLLEQLGVDRRDLH